MIKYHKFKLFNNFINLPSSHKLGSKGLSQIIFFSLKKKIIMKIISILYEINLIYFFNLFFKLNAKNISKDLFILIQNTSHESKKEIKFLINKKTKVIDFIHKKGLNKLGKLAIKNEIKILKYLNKKKINICPKLFLKKGVYKQGFLSYEFSSIEIDKKKYLFLHKLIQKKKVSINKFVKEVKSSKLYSEIKYSYIQKFISKIPTKLDSKYVISHGDFTPWNLLENKKKHVVGIDWEYGEYNSLPFVDILHYQTKIDFLINKNNSFNSNFLNITKNKNFKFYQKKLNIQNKDLNFYLKLSYIILILRWDKIMKNHPYPVYLRANLKVFFSTDFT